MDPILTVFAALAVLLRIAMLAVLIRHERALKQDGAIEIGAKNSLLMAAAHVAFYLAAIAEAATRGATFAGISWLGLALYLFGIAMLFVVVRLLGRFWTVKLLLARDHVLVTHPLFRRVRNPNYFLNILPELAGFALVLHAYATLVIGLALYAVPLVIRIRQEERAMRARFTSY